MKRDNKAEEESDAAEGKHISFFAYLDKHGRIVVPLRNREEADIANIAGADVEVNMIVKKVYRKKENG